MSRKVIAVVQLSRPPRPGPAAGRDKIAGAVEQVGALLHGAAETHHRVFRIVDGADAD